MLYYQIGKISRIPTIHFSKLVAAEHIQSELRHLIETVTMNEIKSKVQV